MQQLSHHVHIMHAEPLVSAGLHAFLAGRDDWTVTLDAKTPQGRRSARVLVCDHATGIALARQAVHGDAFVLVVTSLDKEWDVQVALANGVHGYLLQDCDADELARAVRVLLHGQRYLSAPIAAKVADSARRTSLTARQIDVLQLLGEGCCNKQIARRLGIGVGTVKTHVKGLMARLDATARTHAVVVAAQRGLITPGRRGIVHPYPI
ncbi:LuxR family transcriptional regulator [Massilia sp. KIM]|uniref:response regulator transcription factor n=1 Tax=Massilia sp. KIM TaxID=1955422 RepID=UPI0009901189|nr:response regulator transcription factor [Massilia sp. KIM]OON59258.1 LuxR family transcriptional regulator [Massilia sp. KIM]